MFTDYLPADSRKIRRIDYRHISLELSAVLFPLWNRFPAPAGMPGLYNIYFRAPMPVHF